MKIPFLDLKKQYYAIKEEIDKSIQNVIEESAFIGGRYLKTFETNFAEKIGLRYCIGVGNGTDALYIALRSLGISPGDEVITAANSFIATSEAITLAGAQVRFVDCDEKTYNIDVDRLEEALTERTKAIIPVHLYGQPADMDDILRFANHNGLFVVEDAAQAHLATYKDKNVGTMGQAACFSFFPGKNLGAYGDGGAVVTNDNELSRKVRMIANHGRIEKYDHEFEGVNSRLDGLQSAILNVKLKHLDKWNERRINVAARYTDALKDIVKTPPALPRVKHVYHLYVVRVPERDRVRKELAEKGIATGIHYPTPLPFLKAYDYLGHKPEDFPVAWAYKDEILSLPIHGDLTDHEVDYVVHSLKQSLK